MTYTTVTTNAVTGEVRVREWTPEEITARQERLSKMGISPMNSLRKRRDQLLAESDWTQVPDAPVDKAAWAVYRQALRDLPQNTDPANPVWPKKPGE